MVDKLPTARVLFALPAIQVSPFTVWLKPFISRSEAAESLAWPMESTAPVASASFAPRRILPVLRTFVLAQLLPVELIVQLPASVFDTLAPGRVMVPLTTPFPAPRRKSVELGPLNPPPPAVIGPFNVSVPLAGTNCTMLVPLAVIGPLMAATPELVTCERRLIAPESRLVMFRVTPAASEVPGRSSVVAFPVAPAAG